MTTEPRIYRIIRFYADGRRRTIRAHVTLTAAQLHCRDPRTRRAGVYFDGYDYARAAIRKAEGRDER